MRFCIINAKRKCAENRKYVLISSLPHSVKLMDEYICTQTYRLTHAWILFLLFLVFLSRTHRLQKHTQCYVVLGGHWPNINSNSCCIIRGHLNLVRVLNMREPLKIIKTLQQHATGQQRLHTIAMLSSDKKKELIHGLPN